MKKKNKPYGSFLWKVLNCLKATEPLGGGSFYHQVPVNLAVPPLM